ncbi:hypothetical protein [Pseudonocardia alni]|uniref:hypothetical protein n=1 Tax=Pseudonocardia alni TaxID=33907 RepID=UPI00279A5D67|nr:hypothetical protein PaSha_23040 [Pseudonocardia alni]
MDDDRAAELAVALAALAGREIGPAEARAVVAHAHDLTPARANTVWTRHRAAPRTVSLRDYLAMTIRFAAQDPAAGGPDRPESHASPDPHGRHGGMGP